MGEQGKGINIGIERNGDAFYLSFKITGKLTHADYQHMVPLLESALIGINEPEIVALTDVRELTGMSLHAAWDDLKLGLMHGKAFKKVAVLGRGKLQAWLSHIVAWFTPGTVKFFEHRQEALDWLK